MKKTNTLPFISLLIIAAMITAPLIVADAWDSDAWAVTDSSWSGNSFSVFDWSWSGDAWAVDDNSWSGDSFAVDDNSWSGDSFAVDDNSWSGSSDYGSTTGMDTTTPSTPGANDFVEGPGGVPPGGPLPQPEPFPTNADAKWQSLDDTTIYQGATSGTTIQQNIFSKCSDPDDKNLEFKITSKSQNFELAFSGSDLKIYNLKTAFIGKEIITIECNKVPESFALNVIPRQITPTPTATSSSDDGDGISVFIGAIRLPEESTAGEQIPILISFKNSGDKKLENVKAAVVITDLGVRASIGPFDLTKGKSISKTIYVELPEDTQTGTYTARITIDSSSVHRVKHRDVEVIS